jgi:hypothetical protein
MTAMLRWHIALAIVATVIVVVVYASGVSTFWDMPVLVFYLAGVSWLRSRGEPPERPDLEP